MEKEMAECTDLIFLLEQSEIYNDTQEEEAEIVANMADSSSRNIYRNPSPTESLQFEACNLKEKILTSFGDECILMDQFDEDIFNTPWTDEDEPLTSSSDGDEIVIEAPPKEIVVEKTFTPPTLGKHVISSSDDEVSSRHRKKETKSGRCLKSMRRDPDYSNEDERRRRSRRDTISSSDDEVSSRHRKKETKSGRSIKSKRRHPDYSNEDERRHRSRRDTISLSDDDVPSRHQKKQKTSRRSTKCKKRYNKTLVESSDEDERRYISRRDTKPIKWEEQEEKKPLDGVITNFDEYICELCNIKLNSEVTMQTHMIGKRHQKAVKARAISKVAMHSLSSNLFERELSRANRYPHPPPGVKRITLDTESLIQAVAEKYHNGPLPGLSKVMEIRHLENEKNPAIPEISYYCKLCDSPCASVSIMMHLTGFKHKVRFFEIIEPRLYEKFRYATKREMETRVGESLASYERRYGRGIIEVQQEILEETREPQPGPSWRKNGSEDMDFQDDVDISSREDLSTSKNDYYCTVCDAHMNNKGMWESHVIGQRHLKNKKKCPGENASKLRSVPCPGKVAHLEYMLEDEIVPIVGLEYIRETRGDAGDMYNCFLCGACTSEYDIIAHLKLTKHRIKYLETENRKDKPNCIEGIKSLHDVSTFYKDSLIEDECRTILEKYGPGKVEVYKSKVVLPYGLSF